MPPRNPPGQDDLTEEHLVRNCLRFTSLTCLVTLVLPSCALILPIVEAAHWLYIPFSKLEYSWTMVDLSAKNERRFTRHHFSCSNG